MRPGIRIETDHGDQDVLLAAVEVDGGELGVTGQVHEDAPDLQLAAHPEAIQIRLGSPILLVVAGTEHRAIVLWPKGRL